MAPTDPYKVLGIPHTATDAEIRAAYRRQVQLHHPDHNGGSLESTRRFEQVQEAYALILKLDRGARGSSSPSKAAPRSTASSDGASADPGLEQRLADLERELAAQRAAKREAARRAQQIREEALRRAREAARSSAEGASDEELGYVTTDDSFSAILDDAVEAWSKRVAGDGGDDSGSEREPVNERLADLFDELGARLRGDKRNG
jgi:curved DNA-binding protein CbpA